MPKASLYEGRCFAADLRAVRGELSAMCPLVSVGGGSRESRLCEAEGVEFADVVMSLRAERSAGSMPDESSVVFADVLMVVSSSVTVYIRVVMYSDVCSCVPEPVSSSQW